MPRSFAGERHRLGVVAGRERHHAALLSSSLQQGKRVVGAPELESAHALEVLALEEHACAGERVDRARGEHRRALRLPLDALVRGGYVCERNHVATSSPHSCRKCPPLGITSGSGSCGSTTAEGASPARRAPDPSRRSPSGFRRSSCLQPIAGFPRDRRAGIILVLRHELREAPDARLVARVREWRVVGRRLVRRKCGQVRASSLPHARSGFFATYVRQARKPSLSGTSPVASAVFMIRRREKRSGISMGSVRPSRPPQS